MKGLIYDTATNISIAVRAMMLEFQIESWQVVGMTTDGASNMKAAAELLGIERFWCATHQLHLTVIDALDSAKIPEIKDVVEKVKAVVKWAKQNGSVQTELELAKSPRLIQSMVTRWNSTRDMLEQFLEVKTELEKIVMSHDSCPVLPTVKECRALHEIVKILKPFKVNCIYLSNCQLTN